MKKTSFIALSLGLLFSTAAFADSFKNCPQFFPASPPKLTVPSQQRELCFHSFAVLHSGQSKTPVYVAERLNRATLEAAQGKDRTNQFYPEARLPSAERAQLDDYKGSGFDRGHMAPAGDMSTPDAMAQSFSLANIVPQDPTSNRRAWAQIETATRNYVKRAPGDVFVITGPLFDRPVTAIGHGRVWVPTRLFKLIYTPATGRAWAFIQTNSDERQSMKPVSYAELQRQTGVALLAGLAVKD